MGPPDLVWRLDEGAKRNFKPPANGIHIEFIYCGCYQTKTYPNNIEIHQMKNTTLCAISLCAALGISTPALAAMAAPTPDAVVPESGQKDIFVFFDGTRNTPTSSTNVFRLYQRIADDNKPGTVARYFTGVGTTRHPLSGAAFGKDMEDKILDGYGFLARNYQEGSRIFIFGFSRGAHQARALAGLVAYAGIQPDDDRDRRLKRMSNRIIELVKSRSDADFVDRWKTWSPSAKPLLGPDIKRALGVDTRPAQVAFLGVWDTVPGSSLKKYGVCKEKPDNTTGDRYKSDSYPPIKVIAHALATDEKRSKFRPILLCPPIEASEPTQVVEKWFPGAHADVGGGYEEGTGLQHISLNWMIEQLSSHYAFREHPSPLAENALDVAHWSIGDDEGNALSRCEDRIIPPGADRSDAIARRTAEKTVPLLAFGEKEPRQLSYPLSCKDLGKKPN